METLADKSTLSGIRKRIRSELDAVGAPAGPAFDCLVAVTEACTNALLHGHAGDASQDPEVSWTIGPSAARFLVKDYSNKEGAEQPEPEPDEPRGGGYGLPLMRKLMDSVDVEFSPRGTTVSMEKRF